MKTIYVALLDEGVPCWRLVKAKNLRDDVYLIVDSIAEDEVWEFGSGETVRCRTQTFSDGQTRLTAFERADQTLEKTPIALSEMEPSDE